MYGQEQKLCIQLNTGTDHPECSCRSQIETLHEPIHTMLAELEVTRPEPEVNLDAHRIE